MQSTDEMKAMYLAVWTRVLWELCQWNAEDVKKWAAGWSMMDELMFYHESELYYVVPQIVPAEVRLQFDPVNLDLLHTDLRQMLTKALRPDLDQVDWDRLRTQIKQTIDRRRRT